MTAPSTSSASNAASSCCSASCWRTVLPPNRGPNSILFGLRSAGGVATSSTKQAKLNRAAHGLDFLYDSDGSRRVTIDLNQTLIPKMLALRMNALLNRGKRYRENLNDKTNGIHLAARWRVNDRTEIRIEDPGKGRPAGRWCTFNMLLAPSR